MLDVAVCTHTSLGVKGRCLPLNETVIERVAGDTRIPLDASKRGVARGAFEPQVPMRWNEWPWLGLVLRPGQNGLKYRRLTAHEAEEKTREDSR